MVVEGVVDGGVGAVKKNDLYEIHQRRIPKGMSIRKILSPHYRDDNFSKRRIKVIEAY